MSVLIHAAHAVRDQLTQITNTPYLIFSFLSFCQRYIIVLIKTEGMFSSVYMYLNNQVTVGFLEEGS